jgi:hypothetical protein
MEKGVIFSRYEKEKPGIISDQFTISMDGDYFTYLVVINALLNALSISDDEGVFLEGDRVCICSLISAMLPSYNQMQILYNIQMGKKECIEK